MSRTSCQTDLYFGLIRLPGNDNDCCNNSVVRIKYEFGYDCLTLSTDIRPIVNSCAFIQPDHYEFLSYSFFFLTPKMLLFVFHLNCTACYITIPVGKDLTLFILVNLFVHKKSATFILYIKKSTLFYPNV